MFQFGKDFDAIQNVFAQKHKKKGGPESLIKTKDQIRHFYYRNWHKISKYLKDTSGGFPVEISDDFDLFLPNDTLMSFPSIGNFFLIGN